LQFTLASHSPGDECESEYSCHQSILSYEDPQTCEFEVLVRFVTHPLDDLGKRVEDIVWIRCSSLLVVPLVGASNICHRALNWPTGIEVDSDWFVGIFGREHDIASIDVVVDESRRIELPKATVKVSQKRLCIT
jgi:hypothetical protein